MGVMTSKKKAKFAQVKVEIDSPYKNVKLEVSHHFEILINALIKKRDDLLAQIQQFEAEYLSKSQHRSIQNESVLEPLNGVAANGNDIAFTHSDTHTLLKEIAKMGKITEVKGFYSQKVKPIRSFGRYRSEEKLCRPRGVTIEKGSIYVSDTANSRVQVFSTKGEYLTEFGQPHLMSPHAILIHDKSVFVTDWGVQRVVKFNSEDFALASSSKEKLDTPRGLASDELGEVYVANSNKISIFTPQLELKGEMAAGRLKFPQDIKIERDKVYVADRDTLNIHVFNMSGGLLESTIELEYGYELVFFCLDKFCNIILSDNAGKCIQIFTSEGKHLHSIDMDNDPPRGIAMDEDNNIVCVKENSFQIYTY